MLFWICPECGHECSPAIRECPTCAMATESAPPAPAPVQKQPDQPKPESGISQEIIALAQSFEEAPSPAAQQAAVLPAESVSSVNGFTDHKSVGTTIAVEEPIEIAAPPATGKTPETELDSVVRPLVESAKEAPPAPPAAPSDPGVAPPCAELRPAEPAMSEPLRPRAEFARASRPQPAMLSSDRPRIHLDHMPPMATGLAAIDGAQPQLAQPLRSKNPKLVASVPPAAPTPAVIRVLAPEPQFELPPADLVALHEALREPSPSEAYEVSPIGVEPLPRTGASEPTGPVFDSARVAFEREPLPQPEPEYDVEVVAQAMEQEASAVRDTVSEREIALKPEQVDTAAVSQALELEASAAVEVIEQRVEEEQAGIRAIAETFRQQPPAALLSGAEEVVSAPAPPATQWLRMPRPILKPCAPPQAGFGLLTGGPKAPTLAGPCLPLQLQHLLDQASGKPESARKPIAFPTWLVIGVVATCLFLGAGGVMQYVMPSHDAKAASPAPVSQASAPAAAPSAAPPLPVVQEHPLARFVEVAGVRIVNNAKGKPQLEYIVVNHSGSPITGLDIRIAGRSADAPSGDPLFSVSGIVPSLGPYQSKEIHTELDANVRSATLPDWRSLRTEILIARH